MRVMCAALEQHQTTIDARERGLAMAHVHVARAQSCRASEQRLELRRGLMCGARRVSARREAWLGLRLRLEPGRNVTSKPDSAFVRGLNSTRYTPSASPAS